jgi:hypothetical protein
MPEYVLNRNYVLRTTKGHIISFVKGEPAWVPPIIEKDAIAIGAERADGGSTDLLGPEKEAVKTISGDELRAQMFTTFELIVEKNDPKEFTGQGIPRVDAVERILGFNVDRADVVDAWAEFKVKA